MLIDNPVAQMQEKRGCLFKKSSRAHPGRDTIPSRDGTWQSRKRPGWDVRGSQFEAGLGTWLAV